jgi:hypothetical protein
MIMYPSALDIFQLLCKSKSWLEAVWDRLAIDLRIIQKRIHHRLLLLGRRHLVVLSIWVLLCFLAAHSDINTIALSFRVALAWVHILAPKNYN